MTWLLSPPQLGVCHLLQRETRSTSINQEARQVYSVKCTEEPWQSSDRRQGRKAGSEAEPARPPGELGKDDGV